MPKACPEFEWTEREPTAWTSSGAVVPAAGNFVDRHYHYDPLGNTVLETGWNATVLARTDMEAYGEMVRESNAAGAWATQPTNAQSGGALNAKLGAPNRPRQTTKETDPDTGLRWFGARWYDPAMGSWISPEPLGLDGPNLYWGMRSLANMNFDFDGLAFRNADIARFCENDPCKGKSATSRKGSTFSGGESCEGGNCYDFANENSNNTPPKGSSPPDDGWSQNPGGEIIYYHPGGSGWGNSGHGAIYDPSTGCAASCTRVQGSDGNFSSVVKVHSPKCHPRGSEKSPWRDPWYWQK